MSDSSVQQLQSLLARVQERRSQPRPTPAPVAARSAPEALEPVAPAPSEPSLDMPTVPPAAAAPPPAAAAPPPAAAAPPPAAAAPARSHVEETSFADLESVPAGPPAIEAEPAPPSLAPVAEPASEPPPTAVLKEPTAEMAHEVPQASGPVAVQQGELPSRALLSFEELVARSLSLRARG